MGERQEKSGLLFWDPRPWARDTEVGGVFLLKSEGAYSCQAQVSDRRDQVCLDYNSQVTKSLKQLITLHPLPGKREPWTLTHAQLHFSFV